MKILLKMTLKTITAAICCFVFSSVIAATAPAPSATPQEPTVEAAAYIVLDANSGKVLVAKGADDKRAIASLTKIMTLYLVNKALQGGNIHLDDQVTVSEKAWRTGGSRMFIKVGTQVSVNDLIQGTVVASGNDSATALSEHIAGSEESFVDLMNKEAQTLGMNSTHFVNPTGLPASDEYSTANDLSILVRALIKDYPQNYSWYGQKWFTYNGIKQPNRNRLLWQYENVDGLKTGFTSAAGYCLIASSMKDNMRLIVIILGSASDRVRTEGAKRLFTYGFRFFETVKLYDNNTPVTEARAYYGNNPMVKLGVADSLYVTTAAGQAAKLKTTVQVDPLLRAPIEKGKSYGKVMVTLDENTVTAVDLVALEDDPKGGWWTCFIDFFKLWWHRLVSRT